MTNQSIQQFKISIEGDLPPEATERIHQALHRALLQELASLDFGPQRAVRFIGFDDPGGGGTQGASTLVADIRAEQ
ncbi:hypothetical protein KBX37_30920 [Micromonospora sp. U56]|uniref:hypothetical protein n=1 Tax=Micromonospora sp. U56 TaxID=2824900 RepID=UPI001B36BB2F|nr:hypothetical protein [Micromonospora sp. U56]MBQ0897427.1 hypothetical protein [Micromonospora sp. U56]